jgi:hypothetical protein
MNAPGGLCARAKGAVQYSAAAKVANAFSKGFSIAIWSSVG